VYIIKFIRYLRLIFACETQVCKDAMVICVHAWCGAAQSSTGTGGECRSSWRASQATALQYGECESVHQFRLKYCSTCRRNRCCGPRRAKTLHDVQFRCPDNKLISERFMQIRSCECRATSNCPYTVQYDEDYESVED